MKWVVVFLFCAFPIFVNAQELSFQKTLKFVEALEYNATVKDEMHRLLAVTKSITLNASSQDNLANVLISLRLKDCLNQHIADKDNRAFHQSMLDEIKVDGYYEDFKDGTAKSMMWWLTTMAMKSKEKETAIEDMKQLFSCDNNDTLHMHYTKDVNSIKKAVAPELPTYDDPLITYYIEEYKSSDQQFISADGLLEIFQADVKRDLAMNCIQQKLRSEGSDAWIGEGERIRKAIRDTLTPNGALRNSARENSDHMGKHFYLYELNTVNDVVDEMTNLWGKEKTPTHCKVDTSVEELYRNRFLPRYIQVYKRDLTKSRQTPMKGLEAHYLESEAWLEMITNSCHECTLYRTFDERLVDQKRDVESSLFQIAQKQMSALDMEGQISRYNADINVMDKDQKTPLFYAIFSNDLGLVKRFLKLGADYHHKDRFGKSVFEYFDKRVSYNIRNELWLMKYREDHPNFRERRLFLQDKWAVRSYTNKHSWTPLMHAVETGNMQQVQKLIADGVDLDDYNNNQTTALHIAVLKNNLEMVTLLLNHGATIEAKNRHGLTPIFLAVHQETAPILDLLVKYKADINAVSKWDETPLSYAYHNRKFSMLEALIHHGADVNRQNREGKSLLTLAVMKHDLALAKFLLEHQGDVTLKDHSGQYAYDYIGWRSPELLVKLLQIAYLKAYPEAEKLVPFMEKYLKMRKTPSPLEQAMKEGNTEKLRIYLDKLKEGAEKQKVVNALLFQAIKEKNVKGAKFMMEFSPQLESRERYGRTALMYAIAFPSLEMVQLLLEKGADVHAVSSGGQTERLAPIHQVALMRYSDIMRVLIKAGANVNHQEVIDGKTPLMMSVSNCWEDKKTLEMLLKHGADVTLKNREGMNVFEWVEKRCSQKERARIMERFESFDAQILDQ